MKDKNEKKTTKINLSIILVVLVMVVLMGIMISNTFDEERQVSSVASLDATSDVIIKDIGANDGIEFYNINSSESNKVIMVFFKKGKEEFEGIYHLVKEDISKEYKIVNKDMVKINKDIPYTFHKIEGKLNDDTDFIALGGRVNNLTIKSVNLDFMDNRMVNLIIGEDGVYTYLKTEGDLNIKCVQLLDYNLNEL
ncbi:MAG: hypothetical protein E6929_06075 [Clostridium sp.]|nr:hypothetical protein [Clostridium sp.]